MESILDLETTIQEKVSKSMNVDKNFIVKTPNLEGMRWINPLDSDEIKLYGFYWKNDGEFYRLPKESVQKLQDVCPNSLRLAKNTSGGQIHFRTNSSKLILHATVDYLNSVSGMTALASCGFDCYVGTSFEDLKFYNASTHDIYSKTYTSTLFEGNNQEVLVVINFPLYTGVENVQIAIDSDSYIKPNITFKDEERIIAYGTSITQGGCASRPGLSYTNQLSRRLKREVLNFGFSGNAFGEIELIDTLTDIAPMSMFIIDYEANSGTNGKLEKTLESIIKNVRSKHPDIIIMVVSRIPYLFEDIYIQLGERRKQLREFQRDMVENFRNKGDQNVIFADGSKFFGDNYHDYTVDSVHPNDLGFLKIVESLEKYINESLSSKENINE